MGEIVVLLCALTFAVVVILLGLLNRATRRRERREFVSNELRKCLAPYEGYGQHNKPNTYAVRAALVAFREDLTEQQIEDTELYLAEQYVKENP